MKIAVIGGGSTYTPELVQGFLDRQRALPVAELWLMDPDHARLDVVSSFARRMVAAAGNPFSVIATTDRRAAIAGADYVVVQLRVGQMQARIEDERLARRHGLIAQETTGVGGFAKALRTIPVVLAIAQDVRDLAPHALLVNFTNPAGLVTEALARHAADVTSVGVCNGPIHMHMAVLAELAESRGEPLAPERGVLDTLGLNHLGWYRGFRLDGIDVWPEVVDRSIARMRVTDDALWDPTLLGTLGVIPNSYLQYFYDTPRKLAEQDGGPSRADVVAEIEADLLGQYADPSLTSPPETLAKRGGAYYSTIATQLIAAHHGDLGEIHVVNVRHRGSVAGYDPDWVMELPARVDAAGAHPLPAAPLAPALFGLVAMVKMYELLTVEAAVHGDRDAAYEALLTHPLGPTSRAVRRVLMDILETNRQHLPRFWSVAA